MKVVFTSEIEQKRQAHQRGVQVMDGQLLSIGRHVFKLGLGAEEALELGLALQGDAVVGPAHLLGETQKHDGVSKTLFGVEEQGSVVERIAFPLGGVEGGFLFVAGFPTELVVAPATSVVAEHQAGEAMIPAQVWMIGIVVKCLAILH